MSAAVLHLKALEMLLSSSWRWPRQDPKIGVSFPPLPPLLFISLGPPRGGWVLGGPTHHSSSSPACSLALKSCCQGEGEGKLWRAVHLSHLNFTSLPLFWEGTPFRRHSFKLTKASDSAGRLGDRPG